jgi:hypothetical protein
LLFAETRQDNFIDFAKFLKHKVLFWTRYKKKTACC